MDSPSSPTESSQLHPARMPNCSRSLKPLRQVRAEWISHSRQDHTRMLAWNEASVKAGLTEEPGSLADLERRAFHKERRAIYEELFPECDEHCRYAKWGAIFDRANALVEELMSYDSETVAGLVLQARAISLHWAECAKSSSNPFAALPV